MNKLAGKLDGARPVDGFDDVFVFGAGAENIVPLKRSKPHMTQADEEEKALLQNDLADFSAWLELYYGFTEAGKSLSLHQTQRWYQFSQLMEDMGYIYDADALSLNQQIREEAMQRAEEKIKQQLSAANAPMVKFKKSEFDFAYAAQDDEENEKTDNLLSLLDYYLTYLIDNGELDRKKTGFYGSFLNDLRQVNAHINAKKSDPEATFSAPKYMGAQYFAIPSFLKQDKERLLTSAANTSFITREKKETVVDKFKRVATSSTGVAVRSAVTSAALTSVSRIAIIAGLGTLGVGAFYAAPAAALVVGGYKVWKNYQKNGSGTQAAFGAAATAGGALLGVVGADALIEPIARFVAPAMEWVANPVVEMAQPIITPVGEWVKSIGGGLASFGMGIMGGLQAANDAVANYFADRNDLMMQIKQLQLQSGQKDIRIAQLQERLAVGPETVAEAEAPDSESVITKRIVKAFEIGPDGSIPANAFTEAAAKPSGNAVAAINDIAPLASAEISGEKPLPFFSTDDVSADAAPGVVDYKVARGDNLNRIGKREFGLRGPALDAWVKQTITLNPEIAANPNVLSINQPLKLPEPGSEIPPADCARSTRSRLRGCIVPSVS
jgi:hypothetical protein